MDEAKTIDARDALALLVTNAGQSLDRLSYQLHRSRNWLRNSLHSDPMVSTLASVASVTGCEVVIRDRETGETVAIVAPPDPSERKRLGPAKSAPDPSQSTREDA